MAARLQRWWRKILWQRKVERVKRFAIKIQNWWKMLFHSARYQRILTSSKTINRLIRGGIARKKAKGLRAVNAVIEILLNRGVDLLFEKVRTQAAIVIQRFARGYICRQRLKNEIKELKRKKEEFIVNKNATIIQKNARRMIVRNTFRRLYGASVFIQGYMKMRWLSTLFQRLRLVSIKIQKAVKRWYIRRKVIREQIQKYMVAEGKAFQSLQVAEQANFFGVHNLSKAGRTIGNQNTTRCTKVLFILEINLINRRKRFFTIHERKLFPDKSCRTACFTSLYDVRNTQNAINRSCTIRIIHQS